MWRWGWFSAGALLCITIGVLSAGCADEKCPAGLVKVGDRCIARDGGPDDGDTLDGEGCTTLFYADTDGDGHGDPSETMMACEAPSGFVASMDDCDDSDAAVSPEADEECNGVDDDCDETVDEGVTRGPVGTPVALTSDGNVSTDPRSAAIAALAGDYAVAWIDEGSDPAELQVARMDAAGTLLTTPPVRVEPTPDESAAFLDLVPIDGDRVVALWSSMEIDGETKGRVIDLAGGTHGEVRTLGTGWAPAGALSSEGLVVFWMPVIEGAAGTPIVARMFTTGLEPVGAEREIVPPDPDPTGVFGIATVPTVPPVALSIVADACEVGDDRVRACVATWTLPSLEAAAPRFGIDRLLEDLGEGIEARFADLDARASEGGDPGVGVIVTAPATAGTPSEFVSLAPGDMSSDPVAVLGRVDLASAAEDVQGGAVAATESGYETVVSIRNDSDRLRWVRVAPDGTVMDSMDFGGAVDASALAMARASRSDGALVYVAETGGGSNLEFRRLGCE